MIYDYEKVKIKLTDYLKRNPTNDEIENSRHDQTILFGVCDDILVNFQKRIIALEQDNQKLKSIVGL